jgi:Matrixin
LARPTLAATTGGSTIGTLAASLGTSAFEAAVTNAFATWSSVANLNFVKIPDESTVAGAGGVPGDVPKIADVRIGAYALTGDFGNGAIGIGPPGFDDAGFVYPNSSYILFNTNLLFVIAPGQEGDEIPTFPTGGTSFLYQNDVQSLILHEIGHTLGIAHTDVTDAVMCGDQPAANFSRTSCVQNEINRQLTADDITAAQLVYGPAQVPLPAAVWLLLSGAGALGAVARRRAASR